MKRLALLGLILLLPAAATAQEDRVQFGRDVVIEAGETVADVVCFGCSVTVEPRGTVNGDIVTFGGSLRVEGPVGGDIVTFGGDITLDAPVGGDITTFGGHVRLGPLAVVGGNVSSSGGRIDRDPNAAVGGSVETRPGLLAWGAAGVLLAFLLLGVVVNLVLVFLTYVIAGERRIGVVAGAVREHTAAALLAGLAAVAGAVLLFILAARMGSATPIVAVGVSLALVVGLVVGYTGLSYWVGRGVLRRSGPLLALLVGVALITALQMIPFLGLLLLLVFVLLALGSAAVSGLGTSPDWLLRQLGTQPAGPPPG